MNDDKDNIQLSAAEDHDLLLPNFYFLLLPFSCPLVRMGQYYSLRRNQPG